MIDVSEYQPMQAEIARFFSEHPRAIDNIRLMLVTYFQMFDPEITSAQAVWYAAREIVQIFPEYFPRGKLLGTKPLAVVITEAVMRELVLKGFETVRGTRR